MTNFKVIGTLCKPIETGDMTMNTEDLQTALDALADGIRALGYTNVRSNLHMESNGTASCGLWLTLGVDLTDEERKQIGWNGSIWSHRHIAANKELTFEEWVASWPGYFSAILGHANEWKIKLLVAKMSSTIEAAKVLNPDDDGLQKTFDDMILKLRVEMARVSENALAKAEQQES